MSRSFDAELWQRLTAELTTEMCAWRAAHPRATLRAIETELDTRLSRLRARLLEDLALASAATTWTDTPPAQQPRCPDCGQALRERGHDPRTLQTHGGQQLTLPRSYGTCPACGAGFFPPR